MNTQLQESTGIRLLKKGQKGLIYMLFSRMGIIILLFLVQILFLFSVFQKFGEYIPHFLGGNFLFTVIILIYLINNRMDPSAKIIWLVIIMAFPVFGALLLVYTQTDVGHRAVKKRLTNLMELTRQSIPQSPKTMEALEKESPEAAALSRYVSRTGCYPVFDHTDVTYFPLGEDKFYEMLRQLEQARHFIFLEYFIVDEGVMWGKVLELLAQKAREDVEIRMMYDGSCEFTTLPYDYPSSLERFGIRCKMFSPLTPLLSTYYNYRDHRKILVIDGHTAFTGGVNLADEYINRKVRFGHWKDTAIMVKGEAVKSFTLMFLQMWNIDEPAPLFKKYLQYPTSGQQTAAVQKKMQGYVLPYGDCPLDQARVGEQVYVDILNHAVRYVHIMTPYLILDSVMENALKFAAERGVEVALILPGIPDKAAAYALAKTHYPSLLESGVNIYEYTPGFVHAKVFVSDDEKAVVGTINLDYRSLYHHFECAAYLYRTACIPDIEADFQATLKHCRRVTPETLRREKLSIRLAGHALKFLAPLL